MTKQLLVAILAVSMLPVAAQAAPACDPRTAPDPRYDYKGYIRWCEEVCKGTIYNDNTTNIGCRPGSSSGSSSDTGGYYQGIGAKLDELKRLQGQGSMLPVAEAFGSIMDAMSAESKRRAAAEEAQKLEAERRAAEEAFLAEQRREESFRRISAELKGIEQSGALTLKGTSGSQLRLKTGSPIFSRPANGVDTGSSDRLPPLKLALKDPPATVEGVPVERIEKPVFPVKEAEDRVREAERQFEEKKRAQEEYQKLRKDLEEQVKELKLKKEHPPAPDASKAPVAENPDDDAKLREAERLLKEALEFDKKLEQEMREADEKVKASQDDLKRSRQAEDAKKRDATPEKGEK